MKSTVTLGKNGFAASKAAVRVGADRAVREIAFGIQAEAVERITEIEAVDKGAMKNSVYVVTPGANGRSEAVSAAKAAAASPGAKSKMTGDVGDPTPPEDPGPLEAVVSVGVEHGIYIEAGVTGSATGDHAARPFLLPAADHIGKQGAKVLAAHVRDAVAEGL